MYKLLTIAAAIAVTAVSAFATNIYGAFTWVQGNLTAAVTPSNTAQTITLKVGASTVTIPSTMVCGPNTYPLPVGTPMGVLKAGSQPFSSTYSTSSLVAYSDDSSGPARRTVPMSTTGILSDSIAFQSSSYSGINFLLPANSDGSYSFPNGILMSMNAPLAHYQVTLPALSGASTGAVYFPSSSLSPNNFLFQAAGVSSLTIQGRSASNVVNVAGICTSPISGATTVFTSASFIIGSGTVF